jgi:PAS domain S-box-containing protein
MRQQSEDEVALLRSEKAALVQQLHDLASQAHVDAAEGLSKVSADVISIFEKSVAQLSGKGDGDPLFFKKENFHDSLAVIRHELALTHRRRCVYPATESGRQLPSYRRKVKRGGSARRKLLEARLRALLELFPDAILVTDARTGDIKDFNESACEMFDYTSVEMSTLNVDDLVPAGRRAAHADTGPAFFATAQKRSHGKRTQMLALRRDGSEIEIEVFLADAHSHGEIFAICSGRLAS